MICAIDTETYEYIKKEGVWKPTLDANKFVLGVLIKEDSIDSPEIFWTREELWKRVLELGEACEKRKQTLNVYSHNANYDFYSYADRTDKRIKWFSDKPFINAYMSKKLTKDGKPREQIKFLDSIALYGRGLGEVAKLIDMEKGKLVEEIKDINNHEDEEVRKLVEYCINDTLICLKSVLHMKKMLRDNGINIKRLYTMNQIAINYLVDEIRKQEGNEHTLRFPKEGKFWQKGNKEEIHQAYRGGRVYTYKLGKFEDVTYIDINSLYPYASVNIRYPDLRTQRKIFEPLRAVSKKELFGKIGISRCLVRNVDNQIGILPVRVPRRSYYFKKGQMAIGTWTHEELALAIEEGYEVLKVHWSIIWDEAKKNPFKEITPKLFKLKRDGGTEAERYLYKMLMNASYGKLAQKKCETETQIDSVEEVERYLKEGYEMVAGIGRDKILFRKKWEGELKKYYAPIIPALITAWSRNYLYKEMKKIPYEDLLYTDTDSIAFKGKHLEKFRLGKELGEWKVEAENTKINIIAPKTYQVGDNIKVAGFPKRDMTTEQFEKGEMQYKRMITKGTSDDEKKWGTFETKEWKLDDARVRYAEVMEKLEEPQVLLDLEVTEIGYYQIEKYINTK